MEFIEYWQIYHYHSKSTTVCHIFHHYTCSKSSRLQNTNVRQFLRQFFHTGWTPGQCASPPTGFVRVWKILLRLPLNLYICSSFLQDFEILYLSISLGFVFCLALERTIWIFFSVSPLTFSPQLFSERELHVSLWDSVSLNAMWCRWVLLTGQTFCLSCKIVSHCLEIGHNMSRLARNVTLFCSQISSTQFLQGPLSGWSYQPGWTALASYSR